MDSPLLEDPWIAAQIEAAVAPYVGRLPAHEIAWMRERLADVLRHDPRAAALLRGAHPREEVTHSGERVSPGAADAAKTTGAGGRSKTG